MPGGRTIYLGGAVNVCSGTPVTLRTVLETVGRELGRPELLQFGQPPSCADQAANICETIAANVTTF